MTRLRARPEQRDAIGGFGDGGILPGDASRMVDTGPLTANSDAVIGGEIAYILGPLSIVTEGAADIVSNVVTGAGPTRQVGTRSFWGGYTTVSYFLTGETRNYDKSFASSPATTSPRTRTSGPRRTRRTAAGRSAAVRGKWRPATRT